MNRVPNTQKVLLKDFLSPVLFILLLLQTANRSIFNLTNKQSYINSWETTFAEALILWPPDVKSRLIGKDPDAGNDWGQEDKGMTEDEIVGWYHWLDGHEFEQALGVVMNTGAWCAAVHGVTKSQTRPSDWTELIMARGLSVLLVFSNN